MLVYNLCINFNVISLYISSNHNYFRKSCKSNNEWMQERMNVKVSRLNDCDMSAKEWTCVHCVVDVDHDKQYTYTVTTLSSY